MLKKIGLDNEIWNTPENQKLLLLIIDFEKNPTVESDVFQNITDIIWEEGTCRPMFFVTIPYLIEIASKLTIENSKDLWSYLGCWVSTHEKYRYGISAETLECFDFSLKYAEEVCIQQIVSEDKITGNNVVYLYASLFAFARHRFGYMTMSGYKDGYEGTSIAKCSKEHLNDVTVYNSGIVAYEDEEKPCDIAIVDQTNIEIEVESNNNWILFEERIQQQLDSKNTSEEVKSHLVLAKSIISKGVTSQLSMKYAFSLYGSLLYCNGLLNLSMRFFHGWDEIVCLECGEKFVFADGWCEDMW